ncbi:hypothetical protein ACQKIE_02395 [Luteibacter sp. NPDC031894]|uniref:hypothetical protein n=1 Tax=Luteibacter sp. NPDC031894 TaxID=3390572 RepID=UPI003D01ACE9
MKLFVPGMTAILVVVAALASSDASAVVTQGRTYVFYNGTQVIGQSLMYCNNAEKHWGEASQHNLANAVSVSYSCSDGFAIHVGYPANIDPWVKTNFCSQTQSCDTGPWPVAGAPALENLLWSD